MKSSIYAGLSVLVSGSAFAAPTAAAVHEGNAAHNRSYIAVEGVSYVRTSTSVDSTVQNVTKTSTVVDSAFLTAPSDYKFVAYLIGDKYAVRVDRDATPGVTLFSAAGRTDVNNAGNVRGGMFVNGNLEVGGGLKVDYVSHDTQNQADLSKKITDTTGVYMFGPYAEYTMPMATWLLELGAGLYYCTGSTTHYDEATSTTTKVHDLSGFALNADATAVFNVATNLDYGAGVALQYASISDSQPNQTSITTKPFTLGLNLAEIRYKF